MAGSTSHRPDMQHHASSAAPIVSLRDVQKSFGTLKVLDGVSFTVARGEVLAIIGRSGSGKSTALRCIDRFEKVDGGGDLLVCGRPGRSSRHRPARVAPGRRYRVPELQFVSASDHRAEHHARALFGEADCAVGGQGTGAPGAGAGRGWRRSSTPIPSSFQAASSSAPQSPVRWRCGPRSCCSTR